MMGQMKVNGTQAIPFTILGPYFLRMSIENIEIVLIQWGQWSLDLIALLISLLSHLGQLFHSFQNKQEVQLPYLVYLIFVYLLKENYFAHSYFMSFNHKLYLYVNLNLELISQRIPEDCPTRALGTVLRKKWLEN